MKTLHTALLASSFLVATYVAVPSSAHAGGWLVSQVTVDPSRAEKKTNEDIDQTIEVARHGLPIRPEVEAMQASAGAEDSTYVGFPDQCVLQLMLDSELADLHTRAVNYVAHEPEVRQAQFQIVLGRYERAVINIQIAWKHGEIADDIAEKALYTMRLDAFDYLESLGVSSIRERLEEAMTELIARGEDAMDRAEAVRETFQKLYQLRLESAIAVLQARMAGGKFSKQDFQRVDAAIRGLEHLKAFPKPFDCGP